MSSLQGAKKKEALVFSQPIPKLSIPVIPREFLVRPRLQRRFDVALSHKVTLITAPAGFGKTVFVCHALHNIDRPVAWISLDEHDNHLTHFWTALIMSIQKMKPDFGICTLSALHERKLATDEVVTKLINEISETVPRLIIVLDDYHEINNEEVHESLAFLIEYMPTQVCLFIASRTVPPLPLGRLRGHGHLTEFRMDDLQLTYEETVSYLNDVMKFNLSTKQIDLLYESTEGWIAGLQMIALSIQAYHGTTEFLLPLKRSNQNIMDFLSEEVLARQEENIRRFMLQTSVLKRLNESLCNAITGRKDSQSILEQLIVKNMFLQPLTDEGKWYRYHNIFQDLLSKKLRATQPDTIPILFNRAIQWCETQGMIEEAIDYALAAGDFKRAEELIQNVNLDALVTKDLTPLRMWIDGLPKQLVTRNLRICSAALISAGFDGQLNKQMYYWQYIEQMISNTNQGKALEEDSNYYLGSLITTTLALKAYTKGDYDRSITIALGALKNLSLNDESTGCLLNAMLGIAFWGKGNLKTSYRYFKECARLGKEENHNTITQDAIVAMAITQFTMGHIKSAENICQEAVQLAIGSDKRESSEAKNAYLFLGQIMYQKNEINSAETYVNRAINLSKRNEDPVKCLLCHFALARINLTKGNLNKAMESVSQARLYTYECDSQSRFQADVFMTYFALKLGNIQEATDNAHNWINFQNQDDNSTSSLMMINDQFRYDVRDIWCESPYITLLRLYLARNETDKMEAVLEDIKEQLVKRDSVFHLIECLILEALMYQAQNKMEKAMEIMKQVFVKIEPEEYVRIFMDEGESMCQLLREAKRRSVAPSYISKLFTKFFSPGCQILNMPNPPDISLSNSASSVQGENLSARELEVLQLMATGLSNSEIADNLTIAVTTTKKHIANIYGKLGAKNRTSAIAHGKFLGLL